MLVLFLFENVHRMSTSGENVALVTLPSTPGGRRWLDHNLPTEFIGRDNAALPGNGRKGYNYINLVKSKQGLIDK